jgi:hypothetical protein
MSGNVVLAKVQWVPGGEAARNGTLTMLSRQRSPPSCQN